jgi:hypothetical protein
VGVGSDVVDCVGCEDDALGKLRRSRSLRTKFCNITYKRGFSVDQGMVIETGGASAAVQISPVTSSYPLESSPLAHQIRKYFTKKSDSRDDFGMFKIGPLLVNRVNKKFLSFCQF